jgi:Amt family ammonium transporter
MAVWRAAGAGWLATSDAQDPTTLLADQVDILQEQLIVTAGQPLVLWIMVGILVTLLLQVPYVLLELSIPADHLLHPIVRNILLCGQVSLWWYCLGWALAYGNGNPFLGTSEFFLTTSGSFPGTTGQTYAHFMFGWAIVCLIGTITSSVMSSRVTFRTHFFTWFFTAIWIQTIPAHWIWSHTGWLSPNSTTWSLGLNGFLDWGGAACIHCVAATMAFIASVFLGPRVPGLGPNPLSETRVVQENQNKEYLWAAHLLLFVGLFCLNSVPGLFCLANVTYANQFIAVSRAMALGLIAGFTGPWIIWVWTWWWNKRKLPKPYTIPTRLLMNSVLVSVISVSSGGAFMEMWAAIPSAFIGVAFFYGVSWTLDRAGVDDPHDLIAIHGAGGVWGCITTGVFANPTDIEQSLGIISPRYGWILGGGLEQLSIQFIGMAAVVLWVLCNTALLFWALNWWQILVPGGKMANRWHRSRTQSGTDPLVPAENELSPAPAPAAVDQSGTMLSMNGTPLPPYHTASHRGTNSGIEIPAPRSVESTVQRSGGTVPQYMSGFVGYDDVPTGQMPDGGWAYS